MSKPPPDPEQLARLERLAAIPDEQIDTADIPEASEEAWRYARRPGLGEPRVLPVAIEADLFDWFRQHADDPAAEINRILRRHIADATSTTRKRRA